MILKKIRIIPNGGPSTKYLVNTPQNCQGHQKQGKFEKLSQPSRVYGDMTNKCNMASWMGFWYRKRKLGIN